MDNIKDSSIEQMEERIKKNPELGEDKLHDHNRIVYNIYLGNGLATIKLVVIIFNISFFMGVFWLVFCDLSRDIEKENEAGTENLNDWHMTFLYQYNFEDRAEAF